VLTGTQGQEEIIERVAALDIGKAELTCCVRVQDEDRPGKRLQEVEACSTMARPLLGMSDHLRCLGVTRVVREATPDHWKPVSRRPGHAHTRCRVGRRARPAQPGRTRLWSAPSGTRRCHRWSLL